MKETPSKRPRRKWSIEQRWVFWVTVVTVVLIGGTLGAYWIDEKIGWRRWEAYKKEAAERGVKLSFEEFETPWVDRKENFWEAPFFQKDATGNYPRMDICWHPPRDARGRNNRRRSSGESLEGWRSGFVEKQLLVAEDPRPTREALERALMNFSRDWKAFCETSARPKSNLRQEVGPRAPYQEILRLEFSARLCRLHIELRLAAGDPGGALEDWRRLVRLRDVCAAQEWETAISDRREIDWNALDAFREGWREKIWGDEEYASIAQAWAEVDHLAEFVVAMNFHRVECLNSLENSRIDASIPMSRFWEGTSSVPYSLVRFNRWLDTRLGQIDVAGHRCGDKVVYGEPAERPYELDQLGALSFFEKRRYLRFHRFGGEFEGDWKMFLTPALWLAVQIDEARVVCALERYRLARGKYPERLGELVQAGFLAAVPNDIFDGKPLRYRREDAGFVLYSVGLNGSDEGGEPSTEVRPHADWIWDEYEW